MTDPFENFADDYETGLAKGLSVSGENKQFFVRGRVKWLGECLSELQIAPRQILDYGCGPGDSADILLTHLLGAQNYLGLDQSSKLLEQARRLHGKMKMNRQFLRIDEYKPDGTMDLIYANGVFHHIPVMERPSAIDYIYRCLRPAGLFALWDNNPYNPGTRLVMRRIPFDRDAVVLTSAESRELLCAQGFHVLRTDYLFIFPRFLSRLRWMEPYVCRLPLGAQYQVLAQKPS